MLDHLLDLVTGNGEIATGIEYVGLFVEYATDTRCHSKTDIGVDVDLANSECSCLTELLLRDTNCIRHVSAVLVNHLNEFLRYGRRTVKNDRETRESLDALFKNVETERRRYENAVSISCASLLILVGVVLDTLQQIESHLLMRHYDGLMKTGRLTGRSGM